MPKSSIQRLFVAESKRVKCVDFHDLQPLVLCALYDGSLIVYNYLTQSVVQSIVVSTEPVRSARFVPSSLGKTWIIAASDDGSVRIFNSNTSEKIKTIEVSADYLRSVAVHPSEPIFLVSGDDMLIRSYTWDNNNEFKLTNTFEGHGHYVMTVVFNPNDPNQFASASLDNTAKLWSLKHSEPLFTLSGHTKGLDSVSFFPSLEFPYLATSADDHTVKIWDLTNRTCVRTLTHHTNNVSAVFFHPKLPLLISGAEDSNICIYDVPSFDLVHSLSYGMNRVWALAAFPDSSLLAAGADDGCMVLKLGKDIPVVSLGTDGRVVLAKDGEVSLLEPRRNILKGDLKANEGQALNLEPTRSKTVDFDVENVCHRPEGKYVAVVGGGTWSLFSSLALAPQETGKGELFCWSTGSKSGVTFGTSEGSKIHVYTKQSGQKDFIQRLVISPGFVPAFLFTGPLCCAATESFACFFDWETGELVQRLDVAITSVLWNNKGDQVCVFGNEGLFVLEYVPTAEQDEEAFQVLYDYSVSAQSVAWVSSRSIIFSTGAPDSRIFFWCGQKPIELERLSSEQYVLGFLEDAGCFLTVDKKGSLVYFILPSNLIAAHESLCSGKYEILDEVLPSLVGTAYASGLLDLLESQEHYDRALVLAQDLSKKIELSLKVKNYELALEVADKLQDVSTFHSVGSSALIDGEFEIAKQMFIKSSDYNSLLVLAVSLNDLELAQLVKNKARESGDVSTSYLSSFVTNDVEGCVEVLKGAGMYAEASHFARTYSPSFLPECVSLWKNSLSKTNPRLAESLNLPIVEHSVSVEEEKGEEEVEEFEEAREDNEEKKEDVVIPSPDLSVSPLFHTPPLEVGKKSD
ncbi:hypothetical protein RCL1_004452 [Eukaryota sp. TZLM3-RCL]